MGIWHTVHLAVERDNLEQAPLIDELNACHGVRQLEAEWYYPNRNRDPNVNPIRWEPSGGKSYGGTLHVLSIPAGGSYLHVWPKRAEFGYANKWGCLWVYPEFQNLFRRACSDLAQVLGSKVAIYTPEVYWVKGDTLDEIMGSLRQDRGDPAPTIAALQEADLAARDLYTAKGCYYIDTFDDLLNRSGVSPNGGVRGT